VVVRYEEDYLNGLGFLYEIDTELSLLVPPFDHD